MPGTTNHALAQHIVPQIMAEKRSHDDDFEEDKKRDDEYGLSRDRRGWCSVSNDNVIQSTSVEGGRRKSKRKINPTNNRLNNYYVYMGKEFANLITEDVTDEDLQAVLDDDIPDDDFTAESPGDETEEAEEYEGADEGDEEFIVPDLGGGGKSRSD